MKLISKKLNINNKNIFFSRKKKFDFNQILLKNTYNIDISSFNSYLNLRRFLRLRNKNKYQRTALRFRRRYYKYNYSSFLKLTSTFNNYIFYNSAIKCVSDINIDYALYSESLKEDFYKDYSINSFFLKKKLLKKNFFLLDVLSNSSAVYSDKFKPTTTKNIYTLNANKSFYYWFNISNEYAYTFKVGKNIYNN